jgi:hypothetical protein
VIVVATYGAAALAISPRLALSALINTYLSLALRTLGCPSFLRLPKSAQGDEEGKGAWGCTVMSEG